MREEVQALRRLHRAQEHRAEATTFRPGASSQVFLLGVFLVRGWGGLKENQRENPKSCSSAIIWVSQKSIVSVCIFERCGCSFFVGTSLGGRLFGKNKRDNPKMPIKRGPLYSLKELAGCVLRLHASGERCVSHIGAVERVLMGSESGRKKKKHSMILRWLKPRQNHSLERVPRLNLH